MSTFEKVRDVIVEKLGVDAAKISEDASFIDDLGADSLDTVELISCFLTFCVCHLFGFSVLSSDDMNA